MNGELKEIDIGVSPDPSVFRHSDPLRGMRNGGTLIIQGDGSDEAVWKEFPETVQWAIRERKIRVCVLDGAGIAKETSTEPAQRYRRQGLAFMGAFFLMPTVDVTVNMLSLFGFILVLGIVVDDAIVTGENIYSHLKHHEDGTSAAISGTQEVAVPVTFGILTTVVAFTPKTRIRISSPMCRS